MVSEEQFEALLNRVQALEERQRCDRRALGSLDVDVAAIREKLLADLAPLEALRQTQVEDHGRLKMHTAVLGEHTLYHRDQADRLARIEGKIRALIDGVNELVFAAEPPTQELQMEANQRG